MKQGLVSNGKQSLKQEQNSKELLKLISNKWNLIKIEKNIEIRGKGGHSSNHRSSQIACMVTTMYITYMQIAIHIHKNLCAVLIPL